jgi:hypothetical protein
MELIVYICVLLSMNAGYEVGVFKTLEDCEAARARVEKVVAKEASKNGDFVYVGPCTKAALKAYGPQA